MDPAPAPPFEVVETATGRLYRLPPRQLGPLRYFAGVPLLLAVAAGAFLVRFYLIRTAKGPLDEWAWATFILTGIGWTRGAYSLISLAAAIWCGRGEIEVADNTSVWAADRVGWLRVRWGKLKPGAARKLVVGPVTPHRDVTGKPLAGPDDLWQLTAETDRGAKVWLATCHPREVLAALADELAHRLALAAPAHDDPNTGEPLAVAALAPVPVVVEELDVPTRDVTEPPPDSRVVLERHPDGVTVAVPPPGIWRGNRPLLIFGTIFGLIGAGLVATMIVRLLQPNPRLRGEPIGVIFLLVGAGMFLGAFHFGRKRAVLAVVGGRLLTFETGPLGSRRRSFIRAELLDIACGPSNVSVNNKPLPQIQITLVGGRGPIGMLTGRDETELKWLATVLRHALGIPSEAPEYRKVAQKPRE